MTVVSTTPDTGSRTLTVVAEFAATPTRVWQLWSDARQLERWWGPPTWPATFVEHDLVPGGSARYVMTGPDGEQAGGWWRFLSVDEPRSLEFEDGFADADGQPAADMPTTRTRMSLEESPAGTRMTLVSQFASVEQMEQLTSMGMVEGLTAALGQIDEILAA
ncbi:SRPBCC domain-containing protein [Microlunatus lacustris]